MRHPDLSGGLRVDIGLTRDIRSVNAKLILILHLRKKRKKMGKGKGVLLVLPHSNICITSRDKVFELTKLIVTP